MSVLRDLTPTEKVDALIELGLADTREEAAAMLLDMGEITEYEAEEAA